MDLVIFGAQAIALGAFEALENLCPKRKVRCFLVSKLDYNLPELRQLPVKELSAFSGEIAPEEKKNMEVLIATPENVQEEIEEELESYGFCQHRRLDSEHWAKLMELYYVRRGRFLPLAALPVGVHEAYVRIFAARSHKDKVLREQCPLPDYYSPIQAGAALCDTCLASLSDDTGGNISAKNGNYSELTVLYWIWKNRLGDMGMAEESRRQYYGLAQYRRSLLLDSDDLFRIVDNEVDVVLPYPMPYEPNMNAHHERYLKETDWAVLLEVLAERYPDYAEGFGEILGQSYMYNYNIILARKRVLREYCEWLFSILEQVERRSTPRGSARSDRYLGYMGEALETLYFFHNRDRLNIVHTGCKFLL